MKYFFFDIDGTITDDSTKQPVPSALIALKKLQEAGHFVSIATGRAHYKARPFMESVHIHNMVCCGGACLVVKDQVIKNTPLDLEKAKAIVHQAQELGYGILLMLDDSIKCYANNDLFLQQCGPRQEPTEYVFDENLDVDALPAIYKIYISIPIEEEDKLTLKDTLGNLRYVHEYLMFQYDAKDQGIIDMVEYQNGKIEDVVVFGDAENDLVMFDPRWTSVAMGNACASLKEKATIVTDTNVENGIYNICEKMGWFQE